MSNQGSRRKIDKVILQKTSEKSFKEDRLINAGKVEIIGNLQNDGGKGLISTCFKNIRNHDINARYC